MKKLISKLEFLLQSLFRQQHHCPHCDSLKLKTIATKYQLIKIKRCDDCQLFFTSPIYQPLLFSDFYNKAYAAEGSTTAMPSSDLLLEYKNNSFEGSDKYFGDRLQSLFEYITSEEGDNNKKLLEIGSSWGYFLYQAQLAGFDATGIELGDTRRNFGIKNLSIRCFRDIEKIPSSEKFDIVYTAHTLEHFTDLSQIFTQLSERLKLGGRLIIEVPNFDFNRYGYSCLNIVGAIHLIL
jgi:SAM-dependent methyltransferase